MAEKQKVVRFSDKIEVIEEPTEYAEDLARARISDWARRSADLARMEKMLGHVLEKSHRDSMYRAIYGGSKKILNENMS